MLLLRARSGGDIKSGALYDDRVVLDEFTTKGSQAGKSYENVHEIPSYLHGSAQNSSLDVPPSTSYQSYYNPDFVSGPIQDPRIGGQFG